jgi:hypothetical protein
MAVETVFLPTSTDRRPSDEILQRVDYIPIANSPLSIDYYILQKLVFKRHARVGKFNELTAEWTGKKYLKMEFTDPEIGHPLYINILHSRELEDLQSEFSLRTPPIGRIYSAISTAYDRLMPAATE